MKVVKLYKYDTTNKAVILVDTEVEDTFEFEYVPQVVSVKNSHKNQYENKIIKVRKDLVEANAEASEVRVEEVVEEVPIEEPQVEVAVEEVPVEEEIKPKGKKASGKKGTSTNKE